MSAWSRCKGTCGPLWSSAGRTRFALAGSIAAAAVTAGCAASDGRSAASPSEPRAAELPPIIAALPDADEGPGALALAAESGPAFPEPVNLAPARWLVLGPFSQPPGSRAEAIDHDYLASIGGEAEPKLTPATRLDVGGSAQSVREVAAEGGRSVDLKALYAGDTDFRVAYAYAELERPRDELVQASFGSDDGAAVWVNGQRIHRLITPGRGLDVDADHFSVPLRSGTNRLLVKVENGAGGWAFALQLLDGEGERRARAIEQRRRLEQLAFGPASKRFLLATEFPDLVWERPEAAAAVFGAAAPNVRWFDPELSEVARPEKLGRYIALVEAQTRDGHTARRMLTFAKVPPDLLPRSQAPPLAEPPALTTEFSAALSAAQRSELSRHFWRALAEYLDEGENAAIAQSALFELRARPPAAEVPVWLQSGFIASAEQQLRLRTKLEGRSPRRLPPPAPANPRAPELRAGGEREAGIRSGTVARLRALSKDWLTQDDNGFVVLLARRGVVFMHEGFGGFEKEQGFRPASIGKLIAGLTFARAVDQRLLDFDDPIGTVLPEWKQGRTASVTFRHCFNHVAGLRGHASHGGLFNAYLDNALWVQDSLFAPPLQSHRYNGDSYDLAGKALELVTGQSIWRLLYENLQKPFGEAVTQFDLGFGERFTARYLAKVGQMLLQDGSYGAYRFYSPGFVARLRPERVAGHAPGFPDEKLEWGIGQTWMPDPSSGPREQGVLGPNVFGHGAASGSVFRVDPDHQLVVVIGRDAHRDWGSNEQFAAKFMRALADGLAPDTKPAPGAQPAPAAPMARAAASD